MKDNMTGIIGIDGEGPRFATGQAVKCRTLRRWFSETYGADQVLFGNIDSARKHPVRVFRNMLRCLRYCRNIIFMPGQNTEFFTPLLLRMNALFHRRIQYIVTGGDLADVIRRRPSLGRQVARFAGVHVQSLKLRDELREMGVRCAMYLPNCRDYVPPEELHPYDRRPLHLCTYSRVTREKGILDAIEICRKANELIGEPVFVLDVYGKLYADFEPEFQKALDESHGLVRYHGVRSSSETVATLRECFAILFPTYFECECFAGTALDAFSARIPIIANDWLYNREVIEHGKNGFVYSFRNNDEAAGLVKELYNTPSLYEKIQEGCEESMRRFSTEEVMRRFVEEAQIR